MLKIKKISVLGHQAILNVKVHHSQSVVRDKMGQVGLERPRVWDAPQDMISPVWSRADQVGLGLESFLTSRACDLVFS